MGSRSVARAAAGQVTSCAGGQAVLGEARHERAARNSEELRASVWLPFARSSASTIIARSRSITPARSGATSTTTDESFSTGRCSGRIGSVPASSTARSITLRSSRMLPGQRVAREQRRAPRRVELRRASRRAARAACDDERARERLDLVDALAQRRDHERDAVEPEVAGPGGTRRARPRLRDRGWSRRRSARRSARGLSAADAQHLALLEHAQQLGLHRRSAARRSRRGTPCRRAAVSSRPGLVCVGAGERAALVAEQLALEQRLGQRGAVERAGTACRARGESRWMLLGEHLLADAGLAEDAAR